VFLFTLAVLAEDLPFAGKWKGEMKIAAPPAGGAQPTGAPTAAPGASGGGGGAPAAAPTAGGGGGGRGGSGGRGGAGTGAGGGFGGGFGGGAQKVSLNLKQSKDNKISGNILFGEGNADDVKEGKVDGNTITFKAGRAPQPIYQYKGELKENQLVLTRTTPDGKGRPTEFVLTKK